MEKSTKILIGIGILGIIGYYLYKLNTTNNKNTTSNIIKPIVVTNDVIPMQNVIVPQVPIVAPIIPNSIIHPTTKKLITTNTNTNTISQNIGSIVNNSSQVNTGGSAGGSFDIGTTKDTTLENTNSSLGSLTTAGQDYTNNPNPTGYVDNQYPETIVVLPQAQPEITQNDISNPSTPDSLPSDVPNWALNSPDPILDSAVVEGGGDNSNYNETIHGLGGTPSS